MNWEKLTGDGNFFQLPSKFYSFFWLIISILGVRVHAIERIVCSQNSGESQEVSARADNISRVSSSLLWLAVTRPSASLEHSFSNTRKRWAVFMQHDPLASTRMGYLLERSSAKGVSATFRLFWNLTNALSFLLYSSSETKTSKSIRDRIFFFIITKCDCEIFRWETHFASMLPLRSWKSLRKS